MGIIRLELCNFRNIGHFATDLHPSLNIIVGQNGSGKTSILEAIHFLSCGKSHRTHLADLLIQHQQQSFSLHALLEQRNPVPLGIEKGRDSRCNIRFNGENIKAIASVARELPVLFLHPESVNLIENGPKERRQFIDWGLFHVKQDFFSIWKRAQFSLEQRNAAIRNRCSTPEITAWDNELIISNEAIDAMRQQYINELGHEFNILFHQMLPEYQTQMGWQYFKGWDEQKNLVEALTQSLAKDRQVGYTTQGTHRADLQISINQVSAEDVLSRGQLKLMVAALKLAQGVHLAKYTQKNCIYLVDDLAAELDYQKRSVLFSILKRIEAQVIITSVERRIVDELMEMHKLNKDDVAVFHVEHGSLKE